METKIGEIWKDVANYEGIYQVSNQGRFKTLARFKSNRQYPSAELRTSKCTNNYRMVGFYKDTIKTIFLAHRVVASAFIQNPENKPLVNHKNGIKWDNRAENLEWSTLSENMQHAHANGLMNPPSGENNYHARLTEADVYNIRRMYDNAEAPMTHIAKMYEMGETIIWMICKRRKWTNLPERK